MTEQDPVSLSLRPRLFPLWLFASSPGHGGEDAAKGFLCYSFLSYPVPVLSRKARDLSHTSDVHSYGCPSSGDVSVSRVGASAGLRPGVVSSLDVAHSLIELGICLFTRGRHKEIRGVREGDQVREELSSHIWFDGTHGKSTLEWSAVSPHFSCTLSSALHVPQPFLFYSSKIHLPRSLYPPLSLLFLSSSSLLSISTPSEHPILSPVSSPSV